MAPSIAKYLRMQRTEQRAAFVHRRARSAKPFGCGGIRFATEDEAKAHAKHIFETKGIVVAIERRP